MAFGSLAPWTTGRGVPMRRDDPFFSLHREMNRLFDDFMRGFGDGAPAAFNGGFGPSVDVSETDKDVKVTAELPGLDEKDVEVMLADNVLTLRGEKKSETEDKNRHMSERFYGRFERRIPLPVEVDQDKVAASFKNGVLSIMMPKSAKAQQKAKKIQITAH